MKENKPNLPQWVDPGEVKHTFPPPNPDGIVSREPPRSVLDRYLLGITVEGTPEFNRYFKARS